ncbi:hypothetical protein A2851_03595 [Candidatus Kaiserbacteria bacterium RIFCSPHIGHO2_01_FULL_53_29]|uniref:Uncharacterized protein n=1 Tax=Candidatus Kaiserbacteria bacterium RIFCSPHIGHO2_01_FULL_53_29 TaxID=1798480 RepID=A0A1F6CY54_9BACT|nr:MAG: hypothetical protein A2851_03595 [Candidatus Kaiserbacteria bacterium RIFCSPHIGHO2_01_FULL_53_29]
MKIGTMSPIITSSARGKPLRARFATAQWKFTAIGTTLQKSTRRVARQGLHSGTTRPATNVVESLGSTKTGTILRDFVHLASNRTRQKTLPALTVGIHLP